MNSRVNVALCCFIGQSSFQLSLCICEHWLQSPCRSQFSDVMDAETRGYWNLQRGQRTSKAWPKEKINLFSHGKKKIREQCGMEGVPELVWGSCRNGRHSDGSSHALSFINQQQKSLWWCQLLRLCLLILLSRKLSLESTVASKYVLLSLLPNSSGQIALCSGTGMSLAFCYLSTPLITLASSENALLPFRRAVSWK